MVNPLSIATGGLFPGGNILGIVTFGIFSSSPVAPPEPPPVVARQVDDSTTWGEWLPGPFDPFKRERLLREDEEILLIMSLIDSS